jgi:hypothetical protein
MSQDVTTWQTNSFHRHNCFDLNLLGGSSPQAYYHIAINKLWF